jgi:hypothetical protein
VGLGRWAEHIYSETDFGRAIGTSVTGVIGLIVYVRTGDWTISAFSAVIVFPLARLVASAAHGRHREHNLAAAARRQAEALFDTLSAEERSVLQEFVNLGGSLMSWGHANKVSLSEPAVSSLMQRGILFSSASVDGMSEAFSVDVKFLDVARAKLGRPGDF